MDEFDVLAVTKMTLLQKINHSCETLAAAYQINNKPSRLASFITAACTDRGENAITIADVVAVGSDIWTFDAARRSNILGILLPEFPGFFPARLTAHSQQYREAECSSW